MAISQDTEVRDEVTYIRVYFDGGTKKRIFSNDKTSLEDAKTGAIANMDAKIAYLDATISEIDNLVTAYQGAPDSTNVVGSITYNVYTANGKTYHVPDGEEAAAITALGVRKTNIGLAKTQAGTWKTDVSNLA